MNKLIPLVLLLTCPVFLPAQSTGVIELEKLTRKEWNTYSTANRISFLNGFLLATWAYSMILGELGPKNASRVRDRLNELLYLNTEQIRGIMNTMLSHPEYRDLPLWILIHQVPSFERNNPKKGAPR